MSECGRETVRDRWTDGERERKREIGRQRERKIDGANLILIFSALAITCLYYSRLKLDSCDPI